MDWQRTGILAAIAVVGVLLLREWMDFSERQDQLAEAQRAAAAQAAMAQLPSGQEPVTAPMDTQAPQANSATTDDFVPNLSSPDTAPTASVMASEQLITITTDVMVVTIDSKGGDINQVLLRDHYDDLDNKQPFTLLVNEPGRVYVAQSGLIGRDGIDSSGSRPIYSSDASHYELADNSDTLYVDLNYQQGEVAITKRFTFTRGDHTLGVEYIINNQSADSWSGAMYGQVKRDDHQPAKTGAGLGFQPFLGAAFTTSEENYKKFDFKELAEKKRETEISGGWVAMVQHYFVSAWIPPQESINTYTLQARGDYNFLTFYTKSFEVPAGVKHSVKAQFYAGPKDLDRLEALAPHLELTVDYGWLWFIAKPLFHLLDFFHGFVNSWGWSIILLTLFIKALFFYPSAISMRSMAKMRKLQPMMADLKERFGDDRQKMSVELMKLYKKEKVNPMSGCLPMLIQMPVFISLYWMLMESVELRHAPFLGYIDDLSVMDPYFILPLVMGVSQFIQQKLQPVPPDPMQAKIMQMLPFVFTAMFIFFPAGLVLYWVINNTVTILQQWFITRQVEKADKA